ncbi:MAG: ubiquinone biosynthesis accessory factor UbiJ [Woeseiaceae bacterium]
MSSLATLLRPAAAMINRQVAAKTPARELCAQLDGRVMALRVSDTALAVYLVIADNEVVLTSACEQDPDVIVSGSPISLAKLASPDGDTAMQHGDIDITGDAMIAQQFQKLLYFGRPDLEEELSTVIGDAAAYRLGEFVRGFGEWRRAAQDTMRQNVGEYLQEESHAVPTRDEVEAFRGKVETLRDDVSRLEARIGNLENRTPKESA